MQSIQLFLHESILFSDKTISINLHNFENKKSDKLLIFGLSESGKTTLSKHLAKQMNVKFYSTDNVPFKWNDDPNERDNLITEYAENCKNMLLDSKGIIEGGGLLDIYWKLPQFRNQLFKYPCIIIGKPLLQSSWNVYQRSNYALRIFFKNFNIFYKLLQQFRKDRIRAGGEIKQYSVPNLS